ncbi:MAG: formylglycine-generating enzyme family protein [Puniceicoccaceae bacterium]
MATNLVVEFQSSSDGSSWSAGTPGLVASDGSPVYYRATLTPTGGTVTFTNVILVNRAAGSPAHVRLENSPDLTSWSTALSGTYDVTGSKEFFRVKEDDTSPEFVSVQGGTVDVDGTDVTVSDFQIGRFEVTQELWDGVYNWALSSGSGYSFSNNGGGNWNTSTCVNAVHPVNLLNWYDAVKWCNARSEKEGLTQVYYTDAGFTTPYVAGDVVPSLLFVKTDADGYRLATLDEWYYAANGGQLSQGYTYSGSNTAADVARYVSTSLGSDCPIFPAPSDYGAWAAGSLLPNELGIYDMSGNIKEWILEGPSDALRFAAGGAYLGSTTLVEATFNSLEQASILSTDDGQIGLRLARNAPAPEAAVSFESASSDRIKKGKRNEAAQAKIKPGKLK